jgi:predicted nucleic acid-binding protein
MKILIDTRIWGLGLKFPFMQVDDPVVRHAQAAQSFLKKMLRKDASILFSSQLIAEIFHVLTQRGTRVQPDQALRLISELLSRAKSLYRPISENVLTRCIQLSAASGIHVWDYLVVYPFEDGIDKIYSMDPHFQHKDFVGLAQLENPVGPWKTEGQAL